jgi:hypothetical protein
MPIQGWLSCLSIIKHHFPPPKGDEKMKHSDRNNAFRYYIYTYTSFAFPARPSAGKFSQAHRHKIVCMSCRTTQLPIFRTVGYLRPSCPSMWLVCWGLTGNFAASCEEFSGIYSRIQFSWPDLVVSLLASMLPCSSLGCHRLWPLHFGEDILKHFRHNWDLNFSVSVTRLRANWPRVIRGSSPLVSANFFMGVLEEVALDKATGNPFCRFR